MIEQDVLHTHIQSGLVLFCHLVLDFQPAEQFLKAHHGHRDQPAKAPHSILIQAFSICQINT